jgi:hypothetical protein
MAYWAEGSKTVGSIVKFTNTGPDLVLLMVRWLKEVCDVPANRLRCHLRLHPGEDIQETERYWSELSEIPLTQFYRSTLKVSGSGGKSKRKLRRGIVSIIVCEHTAFL